MRAIDCRMTERRDETGGHSFAPPLQCLGGMPDRALILLKPNPVSVTKNEAFNTEERNLQPIIKSL
jgi:hypothetical protein